jgi:hypothetical protein
VESDVIYLVGQTASFGAGGNDGILMKLVPRLPYSTYLGGSRSETCNAMTTDSTGAIYFVAQTTSTDITTTNGTYDRTYNGNNDIYVGKVYPNSTGLVFATYIGGVGEDYPMDIDVDDSGCVYITGYTSSTNFPTTAGAYDTSYNGGTYDSFITKLSADRSSILSSTYIGGATGYETAIGIKVDHLNGQLTKVNFK